MTTGTKTANLQLTQYISGDTIDYFAEYNTDMAKIDAAVAAKSSVIILNSGESFPAEPQAGVIYFKVEGTDTQGNGIQIMDEDGQAYLSMSLAKYVKLSDGTTLEAKLATVASKDVVTTATNGLMSASDKAKLDGVAQNANAYVHPSTHPSSMITGLDEALEEKLDVAGGSVSGNLAVAGTLNVTGALTNQNNQVWHKGNTNKLLWSGSWNSLQITVPGLMDYTVFRVDVAAAGTGILAIRENSYFRGGSFFSTADGTTYLVDIAAQVVDDNKLMYVNSHSRSITPAGVVGQGTSQTEIAAIYGIV